MSDSAGLTELERRAAARTKGRVKGNDFRRYMKESSRGLEVGLGVAVGAAVGAYIDRRYGIAPWAAVTGLLLGIAHAVKVLYEIVRDDKIIQARKREAAAAGSVVPGTDA